MLFRNIIIDLNILCVIVILPLVFCFTFFFVSNFSPGTIQIMPTGEALNDLIDFRSEQEVTHRRTPTSISITNLNASTSDDDKFENDDLEHGKFMTDEEIMHGHVSWSAYWEYFRARSVAVTFISVLSYVGFLGVQVSFKFCCPEQSLCYKPLVILYFTS